MNTESTPTPPESPVAVAGSAKPKREFKLTEWLDRSKPKYSIKYGVMTRIKGEKWMHCLDGEKGQLLIFDTIEEGSAECDRLRKTWKH